MKRALAILAFAGLAACGGDGDGGSSSGGTKPVTKPITKAMTISLYGQPIVSSSASAAAPSVASDTQATVQALQAALAAQGVAATVTPQVMTGTSLHALVTVGSNGQPPTADQFKADPSSYVLANFQLDDMVTPWMDPAQQAAAEQFKQDLQVFIQRMQVAGKQVGIVTPIATCDYPR
ncbi:MAG: hypothetical protein IOC37_35095, partial [Burkholderia sp.]|nr:hypothetical protein [Burkholderia sp.]